VPGIAVARALLRAAPILVLDEAVSNLDAEVERDLHPALRHHRPPALTMRLAGRLIVLEHGHVAQTGTYHQLTHGPGPFARVILQPLAIRVRPVRHAGVPPGCAAAGTTRPFICIE